MRRLISVLVCVCLLVLIVIPVCGVGLDEIKKQKNSVDDRLSDLSKTKEQEKKKLDSAIEEKVKLSDDEKRQSLQYQRLVNKKVQCENDIKSITEAVKDAQDKYDDQKELFKNRLRIMYENSDSSYIETVMESKSIVEMLTRFEIISIISKRDNDMINSLRNIKKDVEYKKAVKEREKQNIQGKSGQVLSAINKLRVSKKDVEDDISDISARLKNIEQEEDELIKKSAELENSIKSLQRSGGKYLGGIMEWPLPSSRIITSYFGIRVHPILKTQRMHTGIDIPGQYGASIVAANKGTVILKDWQGGYGYTLVLDHGGGITTLYAHCSEIMVNVGGVVNKGDTVAKVGSTGLSTGPHLHFEVRNNGTPVDPCGYVGF